MIGFPKIHIGIETTKVITNILASIIKVSKLLFKLQTYILQKISS